MKTLQKCVNTLAFLCTAAALNAQTIPDAPAPRGIYPGGTYAFDKLEAINKFNGVLTYTIPITSMPLGRGGMTVPVNLVYSSALQDVTYYNYTAQNGSPGTAPFVTGDPNAGWAINGFNWGFYTQFQNSTDCKTSHPGPYRLFVVGPDGAHHAPKLYGQYDFAGESSYWYNPETGIHACTGQTLPNPLRYFTSDGTYISVVWNYQTNQAVINLPSGMSITTNGGSGVNTIQDRNGNKITVTSDASGNTTLKDDLGRTISIPANFGAGGAITQSGFQGAALQWTASGNNARTIQASCTNPGPQGCGSYVGGGITSLTVPSDSGTLTYSFGYDPDYGELNSVTLPSGANTAYTYQSASIFAPAAVLSKTVTYTDQADGGSTQIAESWSYSYGNGTGCASCQTYTKITRPDNGVETTYFHGSLPSDPIYQMPTKVVEPDGSTTEYLYYQNRPMFSQGSDLANPYVTLTVHSVAASGSPAYAAFASRSVDKNGNEVASAAYDWVSYSAVQHDTNGNLSGSAAGTSLKSVSTTYEVTTTTAGTGSESITDQTNAYWNPSSPKLVNLPARSVTSGAGKGAAVEFSYDSPTTTGNLTQERQWDSQKAASLPASLTPSNSDVTQNYFDSHGTLYQTNDPNNNATNYTLDSNSLYKVKEIDAAGTTSRRTFTYVWDQNLGVKTSATDVDNNTVTSYNYDSQGRQTQLVRPSGWQQNTQYDDANRRVITRQDIESAGDGGTVNVVNYDELYRTALTQLLDFGNYNASDITNGTKQQTRYRYSGNNRYQLVSNLYAEATSQSSGNCGNACLLGWTVTKFDQNGRAISSTIYDGSALPAPWGSNSTITGTTTTAYSGKTTTTTDAAGKTRQQTVDGLGRLTNVVEDPSGLNYSTTYAYDALSNLTSVTQASETRTFNYDSRSRLSSAINPESGTVSYSYDSNGNLLTKTDNLGVATTYSYDPLNRMQSKTYAGSTASITPNVTYSYCNPGACSVSYGVGRLQNVSTAQGNSTAYTAYTPDGYVAADTQTVNGQSYPFSYAYLLSGSFNQETFPSTRQITYDYLYVNRPQAISGTYTTGGTTTTTRYVNWMGWLAGTEVSRSLGSLSALITNLSFNSRMQLVQFNMMDWNHSDNSPYYVHWIWYYNYGSTNNNGNLQSMTAYNSPALTSVGASSLSPAVNTSFTYDGVNRLSSVTDSSYARNFCYDAYGNGWVTNATGSPAVAGNAPQEIGGACPAGSGATPYIPGKNQMTGATYDGNGNELKPFQGDTAAYDAEGRVVTVSSNSAVVASYQYDGDGRRVSKTTPSGVTSYLYDASGALSAEYRNNALSKEYIRFHSEFIPTNVDLVAVENAPGNGSPCATCFITPDYLGNVRMVTDNAGNVFSRHDFLPFGEENIADSHRLSSGGFGGADNLTQRFTGKERDPEEGLDYFGARYYGSAVGRFTSPDIAPDQNRFVPQSWNLYTYVRNNPLANVDPDGQDCITTSNQNSGSVTVTTERGGSADSCSGTYVDGTVNTNSYSYNGNSLSWSDNSANTGGAVNFVSSSNAIDNSDWSPGSSNMAGAQTIGMTAPIGNAISGAIEGFILGPGMGLLEGPGLDMSPGWKRLGGSAAERLPNLNGMSRSEAREALKEEGFDYKGNTKGGYEKWYNPDGSKVQIKPDGAVDRTPPSGYGKGWRVNPDGDLARPHSFSPEKVN